MKDANANKMRARVFRERRRRGVVTMAAIEILASDIPVLVRRGLLKPGCTTNKAALEDAVTSAFEQWLNNA